MTDQATTLFDKNTTPVQPTQGTTDKVEKPATGTPVSAPAVDINAVFADQLSAIKNEEGTNKYTNVSDALHALQASQDHIKNLETENANYRATSVQAKTTDDILELLDSNKAKVDDTQPEIDMENLRTIVQDTITQTEYDKTALSNQNAVAKTLSDSFGEKASEMYMNKAEELGIPVNMFDELAATSPKAVLNYFEISKDSSATKNIQGSSNPDAYTPSINVDDTAARKIFDQATSPQVEMWRTVMGELET